MTEYRKRRVDAKWAQAFLIVFCFASWVGVFVWRDSHVIVVLLTLGSVVAWSWVNLYTFIANLLLRRSLKFIPYFVPIIAFGFDFSGTTVGYAIAIGSACVYLICTARSIARALNPQLMALMPRGKWDARWSETAFFTLSGVAQEYLHRYVLITFLMDDLRIGVILSVLITTATFVFEHFTGPNGHTALTRNNIVLWTGMGIVFGAVAAFTQSYLAIIVGHVIVNLPASIRPHLRGRKKVSP